MPKRSPRFRDWEPELKELIPLWRAGDADAMARILDIMAPLITRVVESRAAGMDPNWKADLRQECCIGIMAAARTWDIGGGRKFTTHAFQWMYRQIQMYVWKDSYIWIPNDARYGLNTGREAESIAADVKAALAMERVVSTPDRYEEDILGLIPDRTPGPADEAEDLEMLESLRSQIRGLPGIGGEVMRLKYGLMGAEARGHREIAAIVGRSRGAVERALPAAKERLRAAVARRPDIVRHYLGEVEL